MKKAPSYLLVVVSSMALLAMCSVCLGQAYAPGEVLVKFRPGTPGAAVAAAHGGVGGQTIKTFRTIGVQHVRLGKGVTVPGGVRAYQRNPNVVYAEPNYILYADATWPLDLYFAELWGLHNDGQTGGTADADIDAPEAWDLATGTPAIVAVIDTGVDYDHEDLLDNMWANVLELTGADGVDDDGNGYVDDIYGYDFCTFDDPPNDPQTDPDPMDDRGHGTHCAGTIGAVGNNGLGVVGVNWSVRIMALKFLDSGGSGWTSDAVSCVEYVTMMKQRGEPIVATSNSWGGGGYSSALKDAIAAAGAEGILFVAAAGNAHTNNDRFPHYPSSYNLDTIIAVAASDHNDRLASFSSYGKSSVDLAAPGVNILSTVPGDAYTSASGTSMATPQVSGAVALVRAYHPGDDALTTKARILASVDPIHQGDRRLVSGGRLNLLNALGAPANQPPLAADDAYATGEGTVLNVPAPGVLANDSDPDGDPLTAALVSGVANGTLELNADGSFVYVPNLLFTGTDGFIYVANDGAADSDLAVVTITVGAPPGEVTVTRIAPNWMPAGVTIGVTITGSGFAAGADVRLENGAGPAPRASDVFVVDASTIMATVTAKSGGPRRDSVWDVRVTNPDGSSGVLENRFTVTP